ncbi:unnamed protein product [Owenia fusiformis]|uniref:Uncharacterized protein n=1 Tax=Owenia fusiformis TaxID=6347 RepID=A0A8J1UN63_OWEFU|nr:unnamed protein product [Owenia fusiformis]
MTVCDEIKTQAKEICSVKTAKKTLPITQWLPKYCCQWFQCDLIAGLTVGLTVIPQGLAYAVVAELPPQYGLYSSFMGCFIYCLFGTSKDITLGPTAIMSLMTAQFASGLSPVPHNATYALILTLMCGCIQLLMGILNLGIIVEFISYPVINGFTSAAAIIIAFGQVKHILGLQNIPRDFLQSVYYTFAKLPQTRIADLIMGIVCLILLAGLKKMKSIDWGDENEEDIPVCRKISRKFIWVIGTARNAVIVISGALIAAACISQGFDTFSVVGPLPEGLPTFQLPNFTLHNGSTTVSTAQIFSDIGIGFGVVPLLSLVETIAIGKAFARQNNYRIDANQELIAIGISNILGSFVSAYPVTGSFSRTAVNSQSGVKTPAGGIFTGCLILLALAVLTPAFYYIPQSALAAVIISAVLQMVDFKIIMKLWKVKKLDLIPLGITFLLSFALGIEYGILIGILVTLFIVLYPLARPTVKVTLRPETSRDIVILQPNQGLMFPGTEYIMEQIEGYSYEGPPKMVVIDCSHISAIDYTTIQGIEGVIGELKRKKCSVVFSCVQIQVLDVLLKADIPGFRSANTTEEAADFSTLPDEEKCINGIGHDEIDEDEENPIQPLLGNTRQNSIA